MTDDLHRTTIHLTAEQRERLAELRKANPSINYSAKIREWIDAGMSEPETNVKVTNLLDAPTPNAKIVSDDYDFRVYQIDGIEVRIPTKIVARMPDHSALDLALQMAGMLEPRALALRGCESVKFDHNGSVCEAVIFATTVRRL